MNAVTPYRVMAAAGFTLAVVVLLIGQTGTTSDSVFGSWIVLVVIGLAFGVGGLALDDRARKQHLDEERRRRLGSRPPGTEG
jgi:hypothetical protein